ncbi:MAG: hypothetical protein H6739_04180 [Alphaproteobacteria bacterium]|nr:hypothetical protein [Alphaproteobacteria bacterium]
MRQSPLIASYADANVPLVDWGDGRVPARFGPVQAEVDATRAGCGLFDLSHHGVLTLVGQDTRRFGNSQLTNNIRDLAPGEGRHCAITDRKGRMQGVADAWLLADDALLLVADGSEAEWLFERLDIYIIMDPIELTDRSEELAVLSLQGPGSQAVCAAIGAPEPAPDQAAWRGGHVLRNDRLGLGGVDLLLPPDAWAEVRSAALAAGAAPAGIDAFEALRVDAGRPRWPVDMGDRAFIHEIGLVQRLVSFTKGCYIGQEVINRMETMGRLTRKLVTLEIDGPGAVGASVQHEGKEVGTVTSAVRVDDRELGLAILRIAACDPGTTLHLTEGERAWSATVRGQ